MDVLLDVQKVSLTLPSQRSCGCDDVTVITDFRGQFDTRGVATTNGPIYCEALFIDAGTGQEQVLGRSAAIAPQANGHGDAGIIRIEYGPLQNLGLYRYFAWNPFGATRLRLVGMRDGTNYQLRNSNTGAVIETGRINRLQSRSILLSQTNGVEYATLETVVVTLGQNANFTGWETSLKFVP